MKRWIKYLIILALVAGEVGVGISMPHQEPVETK
jgi:hypothetical protein